MSVEEAQKSTSYRTTPILSIEEARQLIGKTQAKYTDSQLEDVINIFTVLSDFVIDTYLEKRKGLTK